MSQIAKAVVGTIDKQNKVVALSNCFDTWDNEVDLDVIIGGISDRLKAMGIAIKEISFERNDLNTLTISVDDSVAFILSRSASYMSTVTGCSFSSGEWHYQWMTVSYEKLFNKQEIELMTIWLLDNVYHK